MHIKYLKNLSIEESGRLLTFLATQFHVNPAPYIVGNKSTNDFVELNRQIKESLITHSIKIRVGLELEEASYFIW